MPKRGHTDGASGISVMAWTTIIISVVVLFIVAGALLPTFVASLNSYKNNTTDAIAPILVTLGPLLLSVALLLVLVGVLLARARGIHR